MADQTQVELLIENTLTNNNGDDVRLKRVGLPIRSCEPDLEVAPHRVDWLAIILRVVSSLYPHRSNPLFDAGRTHVIASISA